MQAKSIYEKGDLVNVYLPIFLGGVLMALGQNLFSMPSGLLAGGLNGIALIGDYSLGINAGLSYLIMNIPMVLLALKKLSLRFTIQSFFSVIVFTLVQMATSPFIGILKIEDVMLNAIFSGVLRGIGAGFTYRVGASTLAFDVIGVLTKRAFNFSISKLNMTVDFIILLTSSFIYGFEIVLYTIISQYIVFNIADKIMQGIGERKNVMIVTKKYDQMRDAIYSRLNRGVTFINAEGGFSKESLKIVFTVVNSRQIAKIREVMQSVDKDAFMTITDSSEVKGKGFRNLG